MFKWIGAFLGYWGLGFAGALLGFFIGAVLDRSIRLGIGAVNPLSAGLRQAVFLKTAFTLMGKLAKSDGHISQHEVDHVEHFISRLGMTPAHREQAIAFFREGADPAYDMVPLLDEFMAVCGQTRNLKQILLSYLVSVALADGSLADSEEQLLRQVAARLGFAAAEFDQLIRMIRGQDHFAGGHAVSGTALQDAYAALGVSADDSDQQIKRAYRSLMSKYHPDKLMGQGLPEDMIREATERAQEIQAAYDLIKKSREQKAGENKN